jgi:hypothetical protein
MTKMLSATEYWIRLSLACAIGILIGIIIMALIAFLLTEEAIHDNTIKEFKREVMIIEYAWQVDVYPDAKFDVVPYEKPVDLTPAKENKK